MRPQKTVPSVRLATEAGRTPGWNEEQLQSRVVRRPNARSTVLDIGVDVLWTHLNTAYKGPGVGLVTNGAALLVSNGARPAGIYTIDDQDIVSVMFRIQRNFLP